MQACMHTYIYKYIHTPKQHSAALVVRDGEDDDDEGPCAEAFDEPYQGHSLCAATVLSPEASSFVACRSCGAYAWKHRGLLTKTCRGRQGGKALAVQRERLLEGRFPGGQDWPVIDLRRPTRAEVDWLGGKQSSHPPPRWNSDDSWRPCRPPHGEQLLHAFGLDGTDELQRWAARASQLPGGDVPCGEVDDPWGDTDDEVDDPWD